MSKNHIIDDSTEIKNKIHSMLDNSTYRCSSVIFALKDLILEYEKAIEEYESNGKMCDVTQYKFWK